MTAIKWILAFVVGIAACVGLYVLVGVLGIGVGIVGIFFLHLMLRGFDLSGVEKSRESRFDDRMAARRRRVREAKSREL